MVTIYFLFLYECYRYFEYYRFYIFFIYNVSKHSINYRL